MLLMLAAVAVSNQSCKAWRTIATSATYVQQNDSAKAQTTTTISIYLRCFPSLSPPATLGIRHARHPATLGPLRL